MPDVVCFDEKQAWRRKASRVPEDLVHKTKPEIGLELLQKAKKCGHLPFLLAAADAILEVSPAFRGVANIEG
jgi:hypothetical protein